MASIDRQTIARDWSEKGFSCALWVDPPGQCWEDFVHDTDELVVIIEGEMEFVIDGRTSHPSPGEEIYIPAGAVHSVRNIGGTTARWLYGYNQP